MTRTDDVCEAGLRFEGHVTRENKRTKRLGENPPGVYGLQTTYLAGGANLLEELFGGLDAIRFAQLASFILDADKAGIRNIRTSAQTTKESHKKTTRRENLRVDTFFEPAVLSGRCESSRGAF